jgi:hypothetical protein
VNREVAPARRGLGVEGTGGLERVIYLPGPPLRPVPSSFAYCAGYSKVIYDYSYFNYSLRRTEFISSSATSGGGSTFHYSASPLSFTAVGRLGDLSTPSGKA